MKTNSLRSLLARMPLGVLSFPPPLLRHIILSDTLRMAKLKATKA